LTILFVSEVGRENAIQKNVHMKMQKREEGHNSTKCTRAQQY